MGWWRDRVSAVLGRTPTAAARPLLPLPAEDVPRPPTPTPLDWDPVAYLQQRGIQIELPVGAQTIWTVPAVIGALISHESGTFGQSSALWEAMYQDPRIARALNTRTRAVAGSEIVFEPANDTRKARKIAEEVAEKWDTWVPETEAQALHRWWIGMGFALAQNIPDYEHDWEPSVNVWHPQNMFWYWDEARDFGRWQVITASAPSQVEPIGGDGQWIFPCSTRKYPWMSGILRSTALRFVGRWDIYKNWARQCELYGTPFIKLFVPINASPQDIQRLENQVRRLGSNPLMVLRKGENGNQYDAQFEQADAAGFKTFQEFFRESAEEIAIAISEETLTTSAGERGSQALGTVHGKVSQGQKESDAKMLATMWGSQFLRPWTIVKYGDAKLTPRMYYAVAPPADLAAKARTFVDLGKALTTFRAEGVPVDVIKLVTEFEVPLLSGNSLIVPDGGNPPRRMPGNGAMAVRGRMLASDPIDEGEDDPAPGQDELDKITRKRRKQFEEAVSWWLWPIRDEAKRASEFEDGREYDRLIDALPGLFVAWPLQRVDEVIWSGMADAWSIAGPVKTPSWIGDVSPKVGVGAQLDLVKETERLFVKARDAGVPFEEGQKSAIEELEADFAAGGRWPTLIVDTSHQAAFERGRNASFADAVLNPLSRWHCADRPCPTCTPLHGLVLYTADPWWLTHAPGSMHPNCSCWREFISVADSKGLTVGTPPRVNLARGWGAVNGLETWDPAEGQPEKYASIAREKLRRAAEQ